MFVNRTKGYDFWNSLILDHIWQRWEQRGKDFDELQQKYKKATLKSTFSYTMCVYVSMDNLISENFFWVSTMMKSFHSFPKEFSSLKAPTKKKLKEDLKAI